MSFFAPISQGFVGDLSLKRFTHKGSIGLASLLCRRRHSVPKALWHINHELQSIFNHNSKITMATASTLPNAFFQSNIDPDVKLGSLLFFTSRHMAIPTCGASWG